MTYLYYKTSTYSGTPKVNENTINQWKHLSDKANWRITQLPNGFYQTEVTDPADLEEYGNGPLSPNWHDVTRRETMDGAEAAIDGSVEHFAKKLESIKGPKIVKTFK